MSNEEFNDKTLPYWHSLRQICDRVIATMERRSHFPPELRLTPWQGLLLFTEHVQMIERVLRVPLNRRIT